MKHRKELTISLVLFFLGIISQQSISLFNQTQLDDPFIKLSFVEGISLAFLIASMSFSVRIIRDFSTPKKIAALSRILLFMSMAYIVVVYAF